MIATQHAVHKDVMAVTPDMHPDMRGMFIETYHKEKYPTEMQFVQDNCIRSKAGVIRGLHFRKDLTQGKLVYVMHGVVFDVAINVNPESPLFGQWVGMTLNANNMAQLWIPPGYAHGLLSVTDSIVCYKSTTPFEADKEVCLRWDDPTVGIEWPEAEYIVSEKDQKGVSLNEIAVLIAAS